MIDHDVQYIILYVSVITVEKFPLSGYCTRIYSKITLCLYLKFQFMLCVKTLPCFTYFHFHCIWSWHFFSKTILWKLLWSCCAEKALWIIHGLPVTDCMTAASTGITHLISTGFPRAWMHAHMQKHSRWLKIARPERSVPPCLPAVDCGLCLWLFQGVRENLLWWWWTSVWSQCEHTGCLSCGSQHLWLPQLKGYFICALYTHKCWLLQRQKAGLPCGCMWVWFWM